MTTKTENKSPVFAGLNIVRFFKRFFIQTTIVIFLILALGFFELGRYAVYRSHPNLYTQDRASAVLQNISALIQLPKGTPTMAIINNASSAKKVQPFLADADDGDVLIVYKQAGEAILYRPSTNKLVSVGPIYKSRATQSTVASKVRQSTTRTTVPSQSSPASTTTTQHATTTKK